MKIILSYSPDGLLYASFIIYGIFSYAYDYSINQKDKLPNKMIITPGCRHHYTSSTTPPRAGVVVCIR